MSVDDVYILPLHYRDEISEINFLLCQSLICGLGTFSDRFHEAKDTTETINT